MLPQNVASSIGFGGFYMSPDDRVTGPLVDYELGGVALDDASQGLQVKAWKVFYEGGQVMVQPDGGAPVVLFSEPQITEVSLAFDQNMRWTVGYVADEILKLRWYDSQAQQRVTTTIGVARNPKLALDDKRPLSVLTSDIIFAYIRGSNLVYRQQRDRFQTEYLLRDALASGTRLKSIGLSRNLRMQFELV